MGQPATIEIQLKNIGNEQGENDKQTRKGLPVRPHDTRRSSAASTGDCLPTKLARCDNRHRKQPSFATTPHRASKMAESL
jgi:hypothetical protein